MKILKICRVNHIRSDKSVEEWEQVCRQFERAKKPLAELVRHLEMKIVGIDKTLADADLYKRGRAEMYIADLLGRKAELMELRNLLTTVDDDQSEI